ncbi:MAG: RNA-binding region [Bacteroidetes bacterium]|nr:RNA-binding region [Bacteroidota bacterium]
MQIYVGNLPLSHSDDDLRALFQPHGIIRSAAVGRDKKTGESQGYGFVEMPVKSEARAAIEALRGKELDGKPLRVRALRAFPSGRIARGIEVARKIIPGWQCWSEGSGRDTPRWEEVSVASTNPDFFKWEESALRFS